MAIDFDLALRTRIVFGEGKVDQLGALSAELGARVLLVTDHGLAATGHVDRAEASLRAAGLHPERFEDVHPNPTTEDVERCLAHARDFQPDFFVGLGGGSSIDVAKGTNLLLSCGRSIRDYWGVGKATHELLPLVAVPTTAGTGTETQSFALIADAESRQKMACGDPEIAPRIALLDPTLTLSMPREVTACTGLDAIGHAVETAVTTRRTAVSQLFSRESFRLSAASFPRVLEDPDDLTARGSMLLAAAYAGLAIENSMLGAAHSMANPLTARFDVPHGQAVAMSLPFVVRYNAHDVESARTYAELAHAAGLSNVASDVAEAVESLAETLSSFLVRAELPTSLAQCGITNGDVHGLAEEAARQWTARFNPRGVDAEAFTRLFEAASGP